MQNNTIEALTVSFCDRGENHIHNQQIGNLAPNGFTYSELETIYLKLRGQGINCDLINLGQYLPAAYESFDTNSLYAKDFATKDDFKAAKKQQANILENQVLTSKTFAFNTFEAGVLVIKNGLSLMCDSDAAWQELRRLTYDKQAIMYGRLCDKDARHNLCFADFDQSPDYVNGKGTVVAFDHLPELAKVRALLPALLNGKATNLIAEANHYYNINKCGIGYHGDKERRIVVGIRYGASFPLCFYWYRNSHRISQRVDLKLEHGDIYIMDEKACGQDAAKRLIPTLRHAAGCTKFIE